MNTELAPGQSKRLEINQDLIDVVIASVEGIFRTMLKETIVVKDISINPGHVGGRDVSGVVGFVRGVLEGTLTITFKYETAESLLSQMLMRTVPRFDELFISGVGEMANMIHGSVKSGLNRYGHSFDLCLPAVLIGPHHYTFGAVSRGNVMVNFECSHGQFQVEVTTHQLPVAKENAG